MTWLEIQPQDVWLFRDGKPFSRGEDYSAHSLFPPTPLTIQGALRQKISVSMDVSLKDYLHYSRLKPDHAVIKAIGKHGALDDVGAFTMQGPYVSLRIEEDKDKGKDTFIPLFPSPADLLQYKKPTEPPKCMDESFESDFIITAPMDNTLSTDLGDQQYFPRVVEHYENMAGYWLTAEAFQAYLKGQLPKKEAFLPQKDEDTAQLPDVPALYRAGKRIWRSGELYQSENRFGVSTNALTSFRDEGLLYQVQFIRPQVGVGLLVQVADAIPTNLLTGTIQVGGEHRQGEVKIIENFELLKHPAPIKGSFKVVFLTPAYFSAGWQPEGGDWSALFNEQKLKLVSANLYRPLKIGGWNSAINRARIMHHYVAPGSVYYFETQETLQLPPVLTEAPPDINAAALGFGQYAIAQW